MRPTSKEAEVETVIAGMLGADFVPDPIPSTLWMISFTIHENLQGRCYYIHFTDEGTRALRS